MAPAALPQDRVLQGSVDALQQHHQPILAPQLHQDDQQASFSGVPVQSYSIAAPSAPHTGLSDSAMQHNAAVGTYRQALLADNVQLQSHVEPGSRGELHLQPNGVMQHTLHALAARVPGQVQQCTITAGHPNTSEVHSVEVFEPMPAGSGEVAGVNALPSAPAKKRFGGILSGVVKEAAETATKRPPVFRYEDFKTVSCPSACLRHQSSPAVSQFCQCHCAAFASLHPFVSCRPSLSSLSCRAPVDKILDGTHW